jgi:ribonuclease VapC
VIVVDSSVVLAILLDEPDAEQYAVAIEAASACVISAASVVEIGVVLLSQNAEKARPTLRRFLESTRIEVEAVQATQIDLALAAYERFGKRRGHPARLNFGDCFSYALARAAKAPLLFKGDDFAQTDIPSVL